MRKIFANPLTNSYKYGIILLSGGQIKILPSDRKQNASMPNSTSGGAI